MTITLKNVSKAYGEAPVLQQVSLTLEPGKPLCVTGPSGSGKTTLLRLVLGLEKPDGGEVLWSSGLRPRFGVLFQEDRLFDGLDAVENLRLATGEKDRAALAAALAQLLPEEALHRPVSALSGGHPPRRGGGAAGRALHRTGRGGSRPGRGLYPTGSGGSAPAHGSPPERHPRLVRGTLRTRRTGSGRTPGIAPAGYCGNCTGKREVQTERQPVLAAAPSFGFFCRLPDRLKQRPSRKKAQNTS